MIEVGQYYQLLRNGEIIKITYYSGFDNYQYSVIENGREGVVYVNELSRSFLSNKNKCKYLKGYNTPLWKVLNED